MSLNVSVLPQSYEFYLSQLKMHLTPLIFEGLVSLYIEAKNREIDTYEYGGNELVQFQKLLCDIPKWNQSVLEEETRRIIGEVDYLMSMVAAVFIAHVQILACIKIGGSNSKIRIKIPTPEIFIHSVYSRAACTFFFNPVPFRTYYNREDEEHIRSLIDRDTDKTIEKMIPIQSIVKEYIPNVLSSYIKDSNITETPYPEPEEPYSRVLDHNDLNLDSINPSVPTKSNLNIGSKLLGIGKDNVFGVGKDEEIKTIGDPFNDPFKNDSDPFKNDSDPFKTDSSSTTFKSDIDPFKTDSTDPFKTDSTDPFKTDSTDPFKTDSTDPFKTDSTDPFKTDSTDPFKTNSTDPFKTNSTDPFKSDTDLFKTDLSDPFKTSSTDPFKSDNDPFKTSSTDPFKSDNDPFKTDSNDPFKSDNDPFKTNSNDPFKSDNDPFKTDSNDPFKTDIDPFKTNSNDPFKSDTDLFKTDSNDPFKINNNDPFKLDGLIGKRKQDSVNFF